MDRILVVDDDPDVSLFVEMNLREAGYEVELAFDGTEGLRKALYDPPDLAVVDVMMPEMNGYEMVERLRSDARTRNIGIIMLTGKATSAERVIGLTAGADDYIIKPFDPVELAARARGLLNRIREMRSISPLTGLPGNLQIRERVAALVARDLPFALLYVDLDNFKAYNDRYGFLRGDAAIQRVSRVVQETTGEVAGSDGWVGHVGGDDFVVLCSPWHAESLAEALTRSVDREVPALYDEKDRERRAIEILDRRGEVRRFPLLSVSIGVATTERRDFEHPGEVVSVATELKSYAKRVGGSSWAMDRRRVDLPEPAVDEAST